MPPSCCLPMDAENKHVDCQKSEHRQHFLDMNCPKFREVPSSENGAVNWIVEGSVPGKMMTGRIFGRRLRMRRESGCVGNGRMTLFLIRGLLFAHSEICISGLNYPLRAPPLFFVDCFEIWPDCLCVSQKRNQKWLNKSTDGRKFWPAPAFGFPPYFILVWRRCRRNGMQIWRLRARRENTHNQRRERCRKKGEVIGGFGGFCIYHCEEGLSKSQVAIASILST